MASNSTVYGEPWLSSSGEGMGGFHAMNRENSDPTPKFVALNLLIAGATLYLLKYYGFRFNFGVSGGR